MFWNQFVGADSAEAVIVDVNTLPASPENLIYRTPGGVEESDFAEGNIIYEEGKTASEYISEMSANGFGEYNSTTNSFENFDMILKVKSNNVYKIGTKVKLSINNNIITSFTIEIPTTTPWDPIEYLYVFFDSVYPTFSYRFAPLYNYYAGDETTGGYSRLVDKDLFDAINDTAVYHVHEEGTSEVELEAVCDVACKTAGNVSAKVASSSNYILRSGNRFTILFTNANTSASALTLNVNSTGAKAIYIDGEASSSTNYTLPAGLYSVLYDGTNYQINTDNTIPGVGSGDFDRYKESIAYLDDEESVTPVTDPVIRQSDLAQTLSTSTSVPPSVGLLKSTIDSISNISSERLITTKTRTNPQLKMWLPKTWSGLTTIYGNCVWTDGDNIYYSDGSSQYVLNKKTSTWEEKTWSGLTNFLGSLVWSDGTNIYYSLNGNNYVLDKETSTWSAKTWTGLTDFRANCVWTDGDNIYYSDGSSQYVLNRETSTWSTKTWTGLTSFYGNQVWTDGDNIYWSSYTNNYILNKNTSTWTSKPWNGTLPSYNGISGNCIWSDGKDIYSSCFVYDPPTVVSEQYVFNKETFSWSEKIWTGMGENVYINGDHVWTDGTNIYYSNSYPDSPQYILTNKNNESDIVSSADITRINNNLGNPSSASAVTGADAFSKISKLNSDLTSLITETFTCTSGTPSLLAISYNKATLRRYGKIGIVEIEAWSQAEIAVGATINITITGLKIAAGTNGCTYSGYGIIGYGVSSTNNGNDVLISARYFASNIPASYQEMFRFAVLLA